MWLTRILVSLFLFCCSHALNAADPQIAVDLFLSSTCPHCQKADAFFKSLQTQNSWIVVKRYMVDEDKSALEEFYKRLQGVGSSNFAVPGIFFCDSRWTGFADAQSSGKVLLKALMYCRDEMQRDGEITPGTIRVLRQWSSANEAMVAPDISSSAPTFIVLTAIMDSTNPCSLFCLGLFLAVLWLYPHKKRKQLFLGLIFIVSLGIIHFVMQLYSAFFYQNLVWLRLPATIVGLLLSTFAYFYWRQNSNNEVKITPVVYVLIPISVWLLFIFQQTCVLNLSLIFEQWLVKNSFSPMQILTYLAFYQLLYLLPMLLLLVVYIWLSTTSRMVQARPVLKKAACLFLFTTSLLLIFYPRLLSNIFLSLLVILGSIFAAYLLERRYEPR